MNLASLAAKQKRIADWNEFFKAAASADSALLPRADKLLKQLQMTIALCWQKREITAENGVMIEDLEAALESLSEEARLTISTYTPIRKEKTFGGPVEGGH